jgi:hypothetical protein
MDCVVILFGLQRRWKWDIARTLQGKNEILKTRICHWQGVENPLDAFHREQCGGAFLERYTPLLARVCGDAA